MKPPTQLKRRQFLKNVTTIAGAAGALRLAGVSATLRAYGQGAAKPKPVILTTDIGDDIDDTWALGLLLKSPELDLKLVLGDFGKSQYRSKLLGKFLQTVHHAGVPIGIGIDTEPRGDGPQAGWLKDYELSSYAGKVRQDGVQALIDVVMKSPEPVTIIAIGPMPNVAAALEREPKIAERARLVGMYGSVRRGYEGNKNVSAEWNVKAAVKACQKALAAPWDITITPLDTCGLVTLEGERYQRVRDSKDLIASTIIENYRIWSKNNKAPSDAAEKHSSVLFDTVAVYLAISQDLCRMEKLGIRVTDDGFTRIDDQAKQMQVATEWKSLDGYRDFLADRLTGKPS
ncbi:MAG TPA: nucleoside hydrolase [Candidatus Limnocylindrales bacterium]|jgi:inosine-uridine nucleoside N-ribohydrolase|nr:nucleoside hydrolase [Candidatus Limnocylindrales bacterium]